MKKRVWKRAAEIAADLMSRMDACVVEDSAHCPIYDAGGSTWDCESCIRRFLIRKAKEELRRKGGERD